MANDINVNKVDGLEAAYADSQKRIRARLVGLGVPSNDVDDLRHEVFVVALRRRAALSNDAAAAVWLNQACEFVALAHRRKAYRRREIQKEAPESEAAASLAASELDAVDGSAERLHRALAALNPLERDLLALHLAADVPFRTLAELHSCDVKTVRKRFRAAAQRLRRILEAEMPRDASAASSVSTGLGAAAPTRASGMRSPFRHWGSSAGVAIGSIGNVLITSWRGALTPEALQLIVDAGDALRRHSGARIACLSVIEAGWPVPRFDGRQLIFKVLDFLRQSCIGFSLVGAHPNLRLAEQILRGLGFLLQVRYPLNASTDLHEAAGWLVAQGAVELDERGSAVEQLVEAARWVEQAETDVLG